MFILPIMTGHLFWKATILGGLYRGNPLYVANLKWVILQHITCIMTDILTFLVNFPPGQCDRTSQMRSQHWLGWWLDAGNFLNQCWQRSMMPYGITRSWWVNVYSDLPARSTSPAPLWHIQWLTWLLYQTCTPFDIYSDLPGHCTRPAPPLWVDPVFGECGPPGRRASLENKIYDLCRISQKLCTSHCIYKSLISSTASLQNNKQQ